MHFVVDVVHWLITLALLHCVSIVMDTSSSEVRRSIECSMCCILSMVASVLSIGTSLLCLHRQYVQSRPMTADVAKETDDSSVEHMFAPYPQVGRGRPLYRTDLYR
jgi:hypothetical protein